MVLFFMLNSLFVIWSFLWIKTFMMLNYFFCFCRLSAFFPSLLFYFSFLFIFIYFLIIFLLIDLQACMHQYALLIFLSPHILITPIFATFFSLCTDACLKFFFSIYMHGAFCLYVHAWWSASTHLSFPFFILFLHTFIFLFWWNSSMIIFSPLENYIFLFIWFLIIYSYIFSTLYI